MTVLPFLSLADYAETLESRFMLKSSQPVVGLIDTADGGNDHQLQLWIESNQGGYVFVIRSQYQPGGKPVRRCELDRGRNSLDYDAALSAGRAALDKAKGPSIK